MAVTWAWTGTVGFAVALNIVYLILIVSLFAAFADVKSAQFRRIFHWGPGNDEIPIEFAGIKIDTARKYAAFVALLVFQTLIGVYASGIIGDFYAYTVMDPKNELLTHPEWRIWVYDFVLDVVGFLKYNLGFFLSLSTQMIQFSVVTFLAGLLPGFWYMWKKLRPKRYDPVALAAQSRRTQGLIRRKLRLGRKRGRAGGGAAIAGGAGEN